MNLKGSDLKIAVFIGLLGFFAYSPFVIRYLDTLNPLQGDIAYEVIFYVLIYAGASVGFFIYEPKRVPLKQALGLFLLTSAILMTVNWESPYVNIVTKGNANNLSNIYWQTDDGVSWWFTLNYLKVDATDCTANDYCKARIIAFSIIPAIIGLIGINLSRGNTKIKV